jgi:predicted NAD-dependent protein-ADP-ribosyltransferase YbiA (DUF1768 family)
MPATDSILKPILGFREEYNELSNFELIAVNLDGITYLSVEHAYQAAKTLDPRQRDQTHMAIFPGVAKKIGSPKGYKGFRIT